MSDKYCACFYKVLVADKSSEILTTIFEFLFIGVVSVLGIILNLKFWKRLQQERRNRPLGRKGNVIEPIMRWFCILQIVYWPFELSFLWVNTNGVISPETLPPWLCYILSNMMMYGRLTIAFNSLFVALVRYVYIVHQQQANQWNFDKVGRLFQILSISVPTLVKTIETFSLDPNLLIPENALKNCADSLNATVAGEPFITSTLQWTLQYVPKSITDISSIICLAIELVAYFNFIEVFLYYKIFRRMKRSAKSSLLKGVLSKETFANDNTKRMISLKICFMGWLYEFAGGLFTLLTPALKNLGVPNVYYPDAILMFIIIPFTHLMNNEETKAIIYGQNWYQGLLHALEFRT